jgi:TetR/AcrR family transcriptional regulator, ethionamide resistance regulator
LVSVTHKSRGSRGDRRRAVRQRMRRAIEELLAEGETFTELSVARLVERAGLSRSTFYVYFEDKGSLLLDLSAESAQALLAAGESWWGRGTALERDELRDAIGGLIETYRDHSRLLAAVAQTASYDPAVRHAYDANVGMAAAAIAGHIRAGQRSGGVEQDLDPDGAGACLAWMIERGLHKQVGPASDPRTERVAKALTALIWNALYVR